jgi:hypothetical protein
MLSATPAHGCFSLREENGSIIRESCIAGLPPLDLRFICNAEADDANPIESSVVGGAKIAAVIARQVRERDFGAPVPRFSSDQQPCESTDTRYAAALLLVAAVSSRRLLMLLSISKVQSN